MTDILSLPNWTVLSTEESENLIINAEYNIQPNTCLKCGSPSFYKHGPKSVTYLRLLTPFDYSVICITCTERFPHLKPDRYPPLPIEDSTPYSE